VLTGNRSNEWYMLASFDVVGSDLFGAEPLLLLNGLLSGGLGLCLADVRFR